MMQSFMLPLALLYICGLPSVTGSNTETMNVTVGDQAIFNFQFGNVPDVDLSIVNNVEYLKQSSGRDRYVSRLTLDGDKWSKWVKPELMGRVDTLNLTTLRMNNTALQDTGLYHCQIYFRDRVVRVSINLCVYNRTHSDVTTEGQTTSVQNTTEINLISTTTLEKRTILDEDQSSVVIGISVAFVLVLLLFAVCAVCIWLWWKKEMKMRRRRPTTEIDESNNKLLAQLGPPIKFGVVDSPPGTISLRWEPPDQTTLEGYILQYREEDSSTWSEEMYTKEEVYMVSWLTPGKEYMFRVAAKYAEAQGEFTQLPQPVWCTAGMQNILPRIAFQQSHTLYQEITDMCVRQNNTLCLIPYYPKKTSINWFSSSWALVNAIDLKKPGLLGVEFHHGNMLLVNDKRSMLILVSNAERKGTSPSKVTYFELPFRKPSGICIINNTALISASIENRVVSFELDDNSSPKLQTLKTFVEDDMQENGYRMRQPHYICANEERVAISCKSSEEIIVYDHGGNFLNGFRGEKNNGTELRRPMGVALDVKNNLYIAEHFSSRVSLVSPSGTWLAYVTTDMECPRVIKVTLDNLFVTSGEYNRPNKVSVFALRHS